MGFGVERPIVETDVEWGKPSEESIDVDDGGSGPVDDAMDEREEDRDLE